MLNMWYETTLNSEIAKFIANVRDPTSREPVGGMKLAMLYILVLLTMFSKSSNWKGAFKVFAYRRHPVRKTRIIK